MKTSCPHCQARYAIPDARVTGKVLRVRCQRCQGVMKVVGPAAGATDVAGPPSMGPSDEPPHRPEPTCTRFAAGDGAVWWAGIAGEPRGPYTAERLYTLIERGDVHGRTYLWSPGMRGWERIESSARLAFAQDWVASAARRRAEAEHQAWGADTWRPEPTRQSGFTVLDEETQAYLQSVTLQRAYLESAERKGAAEELGLQAAVGLGLAGLFMAAGGAVWLSQVGPLLG